MHRSGTSLLATLLMKCNVDLGAPDRLLPADDWNRRGYGEYMPLVQFDDELLRAVGCSWNIPPDDQDDANIAALLTQPEYVDRGQALLHEMHTGMRCWGWKDPRLALLLPFWQRLLPDAVYIVCLRNPVSVARSLVSRDVVPMSAALLLWQIYMLKIVRHIAHSDAPVLFVRFERLIARPAAECERLQAFLHAHCEGCQGRADSPAAMVDAVDATLVHHQEDTSISAIPQATKEQRELWRYLQACADRRCEPVGTERFAIYPGAREYLETVETVRQIGATLQYRQMILTRGAVKHSRHPVSLREDSAESEVEVT
jgi:hypothetical protein